MRPGFLIMAKKIGPTYSVRNESDVRFTLNANIKCRNQNVRVGPWLCENALLHVILVALILRRGGLDEALC